MEDSRCLRGGGVRGTSHKASGGAVMGSWSEV